jgi:hypothetical protein
MSSRVALVLACLSLAGCPQDEPGILLQFPRILKPLPGCATATSTDKLSTSAYTVRLSFMRRKGKDLVNGSTLGSYELVCDRVFPAGSGITDIAVPLDEAGTRYTVRAEAFEETSKEVFSLEYAGQAEDLDLAGADGKIFVRPVARAGHDGLSCIVGAVPEPDVRRAFHTATALPNGGVLIAGGVVADAGAGASSKINETGQRVAVNTTGSIEIYEPLSQKFLVVIGSLGRRRAFHQAFLVPSPPAGPYQILLLGGVTAAAGKAPEVGVWLRQSGEGRRPFLFSPHDDAEPAEAELVTYTPEGMGKPGTISTKLLPELPRPLFPNAVLTRDGLGVLGVGGGASHKPAHGTDNTALPDRGFPQPDIRGYFINLQKLTDKPAYRSEVLPSHVGGALAQLDDSTFLLVGGNMTGSTEIGERVPAAGVSGAVTPYSPAGALHTAWHTLTPIGDGVLWAGGYVLDDDAATQRVARLVPRGATFSKPENGKALQWIDRNLVLHDVELTPTGSFAPAGYHAAVRLTDGAVLLVGGNGADAKCGEINFCPTAQIVTYKWDVSAPTLRLPPAQLAKKRLGHQATRLANGTVLITGGITIVKDKNLAGVEIDVPALLQTPELYNPRTGQADDDPFSRLPGKDSGEKTRCKLRSEIPRP